MRKHYAYTNGGVAVAMMLGFWIGAANAQNISTYCPVPAANVLSYYGDPDAGSATLNGSQYVYCSTGQLPPVSSAGWPVAYEDFTVPVGINWTVTEMWGNFGSWSGPATAAYWEIWSGYPQNISYGGSSVGLVASGSTGITPGEVCTTVDFGVSDMEGSEGYNIEVSGLDVTLGPGTYWFGLAPYIAADPAWNSDCLITTSGLNALGSTPGVNSLLASYWPYINGDVYTQVNPNVGIAGGTASLGVGGVTPEPISMIFFGTGLIGVGGYLQRRRMLKKG